jgi:hypothetical protein
MWTICLLFIDEALALGWHASHTNPIRVGPYEVHVPLWAWVLRDSKSSAAIAFAEGPFRRRINHHSESGVIGISYRAGNIPETTRRLSPKVDSVTKSSTQEVTIILLKDQTLTCFRHVDTRFTGFLRTECLPESGPVALAADFTGPAEEEPTFLRIVASITKE